MRLQRRAAFLLWLVAGLIPASVHAQPGKTTPAFEVASIRPHDPKSPGATMSQQGPSIFTAMREQLGLKMESAKGPLDTLVIDSVTRPTAN